MKDNLAKERRFYEEMVGIADDNTIINLDDIKKTIKQQASKLPGFKKRARFLNLQQLKKEIQDSTFAN